LLSKILEPQPANQEPQSDHESRECVMTSTIEPFPGLMTEIVNSALEAAHKPQKELTILSVLLGMSVLITAQSTPKAIEQVVPVIEPVAAPVKKKQRKPQPEIIIQGQVSVYWFSNNKGLPYDKKSLDLLGTPLRGS
jgi:hypothetical protein